jgi:hypothetical protein
VTATAEHEGPRPWRLDRAAASRYACAGLANVQREYPNHPGHLLTGPEDLVAPSVLHPIFFGSYDWHSAVHQHWMLVRLVRREPALPEAVAIRALLDERVTDDAVATESSYLRHPQRRSWERPYGWAWLLTLVAELQSWAGDAPGPDTASAGARADAGARAGPASAGVRAGTGARASAGARAGSPGSPGPSDAARWAGTLGPLAEVVRERCLEWLTSTTYPQRSGTHANSAFACGLLYDAAAARDDRELLGAIARAAERWYAADEDLPARLEPSASDFLSPTLVEADLLRRVVPPASFPQRLRRLLPDLGPLTEPALVADRSDPHTVHLDGLNLSRSWCWLRIASALAGVDDRVAIARSAARRHAAASLPAVLSGEYVGEHWLPTFAVHLLDVADAVGVGEV